jgi:hypothetical protein
MKDRKELVRLQGTQVRSTKEGGTAMPLTKDFKETVREETGNLEKLC